ncbi:MAG: class I SAM-dependent DNA methyltransferase [Planctomycetes bacterium]|nr:class I SAM-dependent DNA methyltransferase [Planctomycetota bacterium]
MRHLTLAEIRARALAFSQRWQGVTSESAEKQTFWNEFFEVFGISRRRVASFEVPVQLKDERRGKIDVFWRGTLLVEHKSAGADLSAAFAQAADYFEGIAEEEIPRHVVVSDFARFRVYDLDDAARPVTFPLAKLHEHISLFGFISGYTERRFQDAPPVNAEAAELMADLHDELRRNGYSGHPLAALLVRLMFCLFADHTALFPRGLFREIVENKTRVDGSDVGRLLQDLFTVLDTPADSRQQHLDAALAELPYVNGRLFAERFDPPAFDAAARRRLLKCCAFDWSGVSPAIFGSMFQMVMDEDSGRRRSLGAHYTSEKNILKALDPLLLDGLREELRRARSERALAALFNKIANIAVLDPACGCGNFLIIAYRELRLLEMEILRRLQKSPRNGGSRFLSVDFAKGLNVDAMYGIEIEEFPVRVAETALYLVDHQMNLRASEEFGKNFIRLPLTKSPTIVHGNALRTDWKQVVPPSRLTCIVGNPPFVGKGVRTQEQADDMRLVWGDAPSSGELDYVSAWYAKALDYIEGTTIPVAFVSTNSLTQGEQVSAFWPALLRRGASIHFAHRTFRWDNEAPGKAHVYCVIIGWGVASPKRRRLFDYDSPTGEPQCRVVTHINPYLVEYDDVFVQPRRTPLCDVPPIVFGSMPNDGGRLLLDAEERADLIRREPRAARFLRRIVGSHEFLNGVERWCLWLVDASPEDLRGLPGVMERIEAVRRHRAASRREATRRLADTPALFGEIRQPRGRYLLIPSVSSERRRYVPLGFMPARTVASNLALLVPGANLYHFGVLQSAMHMAWMRAVCGRLESRYRYANEVVYNTFPWPDKPSSRAVAAVGRAASTVLAARKRFPRDTPADLYDPDVMPRPLLKAHQALDRCVDRCYRTKRFRDEAARVQHLFAVYDTLRRRDTTN